MKHSCQPGADQPRAIGKGQRTEGTDSLLWSSEEQELVKMQGAMAATSELDLEHRHGRSEVVQLMEFADC